MDPYKIIPLNDNILIRRKKEQPLITKSNILLAAVEQDFFFAEVLKVGKGVWSKKRTSKYSEEFEEYFEAVDCQIGDVVIVEKNFYHVFDIESRNRVENTFEIPGTSDDEWTYHLTKNKDIYLKLDSWEEADNLLMHGQLFSIFGPKTVQRINTNA